MERLVEIRRKISRGFENQEFVSSYPCFEEDYDGIGDVKSEIDTGVSAYGIDAKFVGFLDDDVDEEEIGVDEDDGVDDLEVDDVFEEAALDWGYYSSFHDDELELAGNDECGNHLLRPGTCLGNDFTQSGTYLGLDCDDEGEVKEVSPEVSL